MDYKAKNDKFLSWFWDLASDESELRLSAADGILSHVEHSIVHQKGMNDDGTMVIDLDYALKRLIRGLSSSRDSARHGFATCLSALIASGHVTLKIAIPLIDESTRIRGKMKGSEERDLIFGKLFAYLAIARSGIIKNDAATGVDLFQRLLELHKMRGWIREVVSEALLVILHAIDPSALLADGETNAIESSLELLAAENLFDGDVSEWHPWQLQLALGIQQFASELKGSADDNDESSGQHKGIRKALLNLLPSKRMVTPESLLGPLIPVLIASAAGFPKIHRVWDHLLGSIFGLVWGPAGLALPEGRVQSLGRKQEALLHSLVAFMIKNLLVPSNEKRSLAFRLTVRLAMHTPVALLPQVLHKSVLRALLSARVNRKHTLNALAGVAVRDIISAVVPWDEATSSWRSSSNCSAEDAEARVAIASVLVSHASANFDVLTGVPAVGTLLEGLGETAVLEHVRALTKLVAAAAITEKAQSEMQTRSEAADEDAENDDESARTVVAKGSAALEALASLAKNTKLSCRGTVCSVAVAVLTRISCFGEAALPADLTAAGKKGSKAKGSAAAGSTFREAVDTKEAVFSTHILEALNTVSSLALEDARYPSSFVASASGKLLTLLADAGHLSSYQLNNLVNVSADKEDVDVASGPTILSQATAVTVLLSACNIPVRGADSAMAVEIDNVELITPQAAFKTACDAVLALSSGAKQAPLANALSSLLGHASFQMLAANAELAQAVSDIASVAPYLANFDPAEQGDKDEDEEENGLDAQLGLLLDACFEFLAQNSAAVRAENLSVKGVAAAIKRVWASVGRTLPIGLGILNNMVDAVVGEDAEEEEGDEEEDEDGGSDADADGAGAGDDEIDDQPQKKAKTTKNAAKAEEKKKVEVVKIPTPKKVVPPKKGDSEDEKEEEEEEEEDEIITADAAMEMLARENSDDEEELAQLQGMLHVTEHTEEADNALIHMLEMRKASRKSGLLDAKRKQLLVRSRAVDMLEAVLTRVEVPELLVPLLPPLLNCLRRIQTGLTQSLAEGRSFESRLRGFIDQRICRKRFVLSHFGDAETKEGIADLVTALCSQLHADLQCAFPPMRQVAGIVLLCLSRAAIGGDSEEAKITVGNFFGELLKDFLKLKKSRLAMSIFDDHLSRFADFYVPYSVGILAEGCATAASPFLRSEASRMLQTIVRRFSSLAEPTGAAVFAAVPSVLKHLSSAFTMYSESSTLDGSTKRLKPLLQCLRDVCTLPVCVGQLSQLQKLGQGHAASSKAKGGSKAKTPAIDVSACIAAINTAFPVIIERQPGLITLVQQAQAAVSGVGGAESAATATPKTDKSDKSDKKRKGVDALDEAEQRLVAQMENDAEQDASEDKTASVKSQKWHSAEVAKSSSKKSKKA